MLNSIPWAPWPHDLKPSIRATTAVAPKIVVLDDDPTGTQSVHDIAMLTTWDVPTLRAELAHPAPCFFILTNTRSLTTEDAMALNREIATNLLTAAAGQPLTIVSRSDSTLRGHFPCETDILTELLGPFHATILIPYFPAGGRYTINDTHYVADGEKLIPAAMTPFARDAVFGYQNSHLPSWIEERTKGRVPAAAVACISLETLRVHGPAAVTTQLLQLPPGATCIVNAAHPADLDVFVRGALDAEAHGRRYLWRTAAQFIAARLGLAPRPLLTPEELNIPIGVGGLIMVGSYVPKTTEQLSRLLDSGKVICIELPVSQLMSAGRRETIESALKQVSTHIQNGRDIALYTSRNLVTSQSDAENLSIGHLISQALVEIVQRLSIRPRYLIAKGGITSSDLATRGLGVKRVIVAGQLLPGVPAWRTGDETTFPGLCYIVFPGNVGGPDALAQAHHILSN